MDENLEQNSNRQRGSAAVIFLVALCVVISSVSLYLVNKVHTQQQEILAKLEPQPAEAPIPVPTLDEEELFEDPWTYEEEEFTDDPEIMVSTPKEGERFCIGEDLPIAWQAPSDMKTVEVYLVGGSDEYGESLGTYPASSNEEGIKDGSGTIVWKIPESQTPSEGYTLKVNGNYENFWAISNVAGPFAIEICEG